MSEPLLEGPAAPRCPTCGAPAPSGACFCEGCGAGLVAVPGAAGPPAPPGPDASGPTVPVRPGDAEVGLRCPDCGGRFEEDWCTGCGSRAPRPRDHMVEHPQPWVAAVSDRGRQHHRNEDATATAAGAAAGGRAVLVVCDGVSSSDRPDEASLAAARAARDVLVREQGAGLASGSVLGALVASRLLAAGAAAAAAVEAVTPAEPGDSPPSCTLVAAVVDRDRVSVGNVGDSRAYWLPDRGAPVQLTVDDSLAAQQTAAGRPRAQAEAGPGGHAITRWLGVDAEDQEPRVSHHVLDGAGWLLLCSDGLWNYCSEAAATAQVTTRAAAVAGGGPLRTAEEMVRWANEQGGKDNITVALARIGATTHEGEPS